MYSITVYKDRYGNCCRCFQNLLINLKMSSEPVLEPLPKKIGAEVDLIFMSPLRTKGDILY